MLEKVLKSLTVSESELPSPSIPPKSATPSPSPSPSAASSGEFNPEKDGNERKLPMSMTTPIPRPVVVRRPWSEYLKSNRERWIRESGKRAFRKK